MIFVCMKITFGPQLKVLKLVAKSIYFFIDSDQFICNTNFLASLVLLFKNLIFLEKKKWMDPLNKLAAEQRFLCVLSKIGPDLPRQGTIIKRLNKWLPRLLCQIARN